MEKTKILVVEDDENWYRIFQTLIADSTSDTFEYVLAVDLTSAIEKLRGGYFELILLDLMLPDSHAENTIERMGKFAQQFPIVIVSTLDDERLMTEAFQNDIQDYLVKDNYDVKTFLHVSRRAVQRCMAKQKNVIKETVNSLYQLELKLRQMEKDFA